MRFDVVVDDTDAEKVALECDRRLPRERGLGKDQMSEEGDEMIIDGGAVEDAEEVTA